jgi:CMP-2-keto-3-deoxyoctulosonic acid synthetase
MTKYLVTIEDVDADESVTLAYGSFPVVNFAAKAGMKEIDGKTGTFSGRVVEVEQVGDDTPKREVVSVQGDAETVAIVLKRKIANERKQYIAETGGSDTAEDAPVAE